MKNDDIILGKTSTPRGPFPGSTPVSAPLGPIDVADTYPTHLASRGKGGLRCISSSSDLDDIPVGCREVGMQVYTETEDIYWKLGSDLTSWTEWNSASAAEDWGSGL
jgi:hypothetical protein